MPPQLTDGLLLGALLTIIAWLFARAVAKSFHDTPDYGSDDLYLARVHGELLAAKGLVADETAGGGSGTNADHQVTHNIEAIARHREEPFT